MLHTELLRLINSREAWAFIGSGPSIEAGCPTWEQLLDDVRSGLSTDERSQLDADQFYESARTRQDLPAAFLSVESVIGRERLENSVKASLDRCRAPGTMHRLLADLPFAGYITTNYDGLLEQALNRVEPGWAPVGNVGDEVRKASGTAPRVVWHVHGVADLDAARSHLVLTEEDYAELYLDESRVVQQMKGLLAHRRVVVIGFGFRDVDVLRMLRTVGRLTDATRPIFALVEKAGEFRHAIDRQVFLRQYRVDVQPYRNEDGRHQALRQVLAVYTSLSVRRSLRFGRHLAAAPTYDPETTGLLIYNDLVLGGKAAVPQELRASILKTRVLTRCKTAGQSREQLGQDLQEILQHLVSRLDANNAEAEGLAALDHALEGLCAEGLLTAENDHYELTDAGLDKVLEYAAGSARLEEQFTASIRTRAELRASGLGIDPAKPTEVVAGFFRDAIERRALGVALAFATGASPAQQDYHALALLQSLGTWLDTATSEADALVVVETVQEIFREPSEAESTYIAMSVQARFVLHVLSLDNDTLAVRLRDVQDSLFLIDASTLIPWLAVGSKGNAAAKSLVARLQEAGATMATTRPLSEEVAEHARWAQKTVSGDGPVQSLGVFEAATGRAGIKTNAFLQGYLELYAIQPTASSFDEYLASCLGVARVGNPLTDRELSAALSDRGVVALNFDALSTKVPTLSADRDSYVIQVRSKRRASASFTHERQVRAEAEAVALVEHARAGCADLVGAAVGNAYFVSYTSMLNQIAKSPLPVTMRPEAALAWLMMIKPAASEDVTALMSELLWELEERRMNIVDQTALLTAFGPLITAARERLDDVLPKYQVLIAERYGGDYSWPTAINDLDAPVVLESVLHDQVVGLERDLAVATKELERMRSAGQINEQDRKELERARSKEKGRKRYERRMKRQRGSE